MRVFLEVLGQSVVLVVGILDVLVVCTAIGVRRSRGFAVVDRNETVDEIVRSARRDEASGFFDQDASKKIIATNAEIFTRSGIVENNAIGCLYSGQGDREGRRSGNRLAAKSGDIAGGRSDDRTLQNDRLGSGGDGSSGDGLSSKSRSDCGNGGSDSCQDRAYGLLIVDHWIFLPWYA